MEKATPRPLYVRRDVKNAKDIIAWAKDEGFTTTLKPSDMHVTITYSKRPVDWMKMDETWQDKIIIPEGGPRAVDSLGDEGAVVLFFNNSNLSYRNQQMRENGASWDYTEYHPHITITYDGAGIDLDKIHPYSGEIILGPEIFEPIEVTVKEEKRMKSEEKQIFAKVSSIDKKHGVVLGWAIICKQEGEDYYDLQEDHIPEEAMFDASLDFMQNSRVAKEMHAGKEYPNAMFVFPLTTEIAKAFGISTDNTGLMVIYKPSPDILSKFESGVYTGFSIGGTVTEHTDG